MTHDEDLVKFTEDFNHDPTSAFRQEINQALKDAKSHSADAISQAIQPVMQKYHYGDMTQADINRVFNHLPAPAQKAPASNEPPVVPSNPYKTDIRTFVGTYKITSSSGTLKALTLAVTTAGKVQFENDDACDTTADLDPNGTDTWCSWTDKDQNKYKVKFTTVFADGKVTMSFTGDRTPKAETGTPKAEPFTGEKVVANPADKAQTQDLFQKYSWAVPVVSVFTGLYFVAQQLKDWGKFGMDVSKFLDDRKAALETRDAAQQFNASKFFEKTVPQAQRTSLLNDLKAVAAREYDTYVQNLPEDRKKKPLDLDNRDRELFNTIRDQSQQIVKDFVKANIGAAEVAFTQEMINKGVYDGDATQAVDKYKAMLELVANNALFEKSGSLYILTTDTLASKDLTRLQDVATSASEAIPALETHAKDLADHQKEAEEDLRQSDAAEGSQARNMLEGELGRARQDAQEAADALARAKTESEEASRSKKDAEDDREESTKKAREASDNFSKKGTTSAT